MCLHVWASVHFSALAFSGLLSRWHSYQFAWYTPVVTMTSMTTGASNSMRSILRSRAQRPLIPLFSYSTSTAKTWLISRLLTPSGWLERTNLRETKTSGTSFSPQLRSNCQHSTVTAWSLFIILLREPQQWLCKIMNSGNSLSKSLSMRVFTDTLDLINWLRFSTILLMLVVDLMKCWKLSRKLWLSIERHSLLRSSMLLDRASSESTRAARFSSVFLKILPLSFLNLKLDQLNSLERLFK